MEAGRKISFSIVSNYLGRVVVEAVEESQVLVIN